MLCVVFHHKTMLKWIFEIWPTINKPDNFFSPLWSATCKLFFCGGNQLFFSLEIILYLEFIWSWPSLLLIANKSKLWWIIQPNNCWDVTDMLSLWALVFNFSRYIDNFRQYCSNCDHYLTYCHFYTKMCLLSTKQNFVTPLDKHWICKLLFGFQLAFKQGWTVLELKKRCIKNSSFINFAWLWLQNSLHVAKH